MMGFLEAAAHLVEFLPDNSFDYLVELQRHSVEIKANPQAWIDAVGTSGTQCALAWGTKSRSVPSHQRNQLASPKSKHAWGKLKK